MTDEELVRRFQSTGDNVWFESLVRRHIHRVRRLLHVVAGSTIEDREDLEQEVLAELYLALPAFRNDASFTTFLYRFCRNKAIDFVRRCARRRTRLPRRIIDLDGVAAVHGDPERQTLQSETAKTVRECLAAMKEQERTVLYLKDGEELRVKEIAEIVGVPEGTVKSMLSRSRKKLERKLRIVGIEEDVI